MKALLTGCTGFLGRWLHTRLACHACEVWSLSRTPRKGLHQNDHPITGDVREFEPPFREFDLVIHGAASSEPGVILDGTRHVLESVTAKWGIFLSSGAVYGPRAPMYVAEDDPLDPAPGYGAWKAEAEEMCLAHGWTAARLFSFLCPGIPLTDKFAAGAFIRDALAGGPIRVKGRPDVVRSYLWGEDMANTVMRAALYGTPGRAYNVGSDCPITIGYLAHAIAMEAGAKVAHAEPPEPTPTPIYVPSMARARMELCFHKTVPFEVAIQRTYAWAKERQ